MFNINEFKKGQTVWVDIVEIQEDHQLLVDYNGNLILVKNSTGRSLQIGQRLKLIVATTNPLHFQSSGDGQHSFDRFA